MNSVIRNAVMARLQMAGWTRRAPYLLSVTRMVDTAVRPKQIDIWVHGDSSAVRLSGCYMSEGRNAISTCMATVPVGATEESVSETVDRFTQEVLREVDGTYARKLFLNRKKGGVQ